MRVQLWLVNGSSAARWRWTARSATRVPCDATVRQSYQDPGPVRLRACVVSAGQIRPPELQCRTQWQVRPVHGRARAASRTQRVSRGDVNRTLARGCQQLRQQR